jgi:large subunit ribosomal protein L10
MSKTIKNIIMRDYKSRVAAQAENAETLGDAVLISIRGVKAVDTTKIRNSLAKKDIKITVIRNSLAKKAFQGTTLEALNDLLAGASALAYGKTSVVEIARELVASMAKYPKLELKGALLDGTVFKGKDGVTELSKFPTRTEAIGQIVTLAISPARKLVGQIQGPGGKVAGIIKSIEEKLEKGETLAKVG